MREIIFRGKRVDNGEWITGNYVAAHHHWHNRGIHVDWIVSAACANGGWFALHGRHPVVADTVGQYTGLTDKNGTKIFEGDIVRYAIYPPDQFVYGVVNYKDGVYRIGDQGCALCVCAADGIEEYRLKVIGNVHDNPELMEDK